MEGQEQMHPTTRTIQLNGALKSELEITATASFAVVVIAIAVKGIHSAKKKKDMHSAENKLRQFQTQPVRF